MPNETPDNLYWMPQAVANVMCRNGIESRNALAIRTGIPRSTIRDAFDEDWSGVATGPMIARLAATFGVRMSDLVVEPAVQAPKRPRRRVGVSATG